MAVHRRASRRRYVLLLVVLTGLTLITLDRRGGDDGALGVVGRGAHRVVSPVERAVAAVVDPVSDWFEGVTDGGSLKRDNDELRRRVDELEDERRRATEALRENELLTQLLGLPLLDDVERVSARVVNRSPGNFEWTVTIDEGSERGVAPDMPVIGPAGVVGRVLEVWDGGAKVRLLVDPMSNVSVHVLPARVSGVATGRAGSRTLRVELDAEAEVSVDDEVVTSGLENSTFPAGLSIGRVVRVDAVPGGLGTIARVEPWTDFGALRVVQVLRWVPGQGPVVSTTTTTVVPPDDDGDPTSTTTVGP